MNVWKIVGMVVCGVLLHAPLQAASDDINTGWGAWINNSKINDQWGVFTDFQVRTSDNWDSTRTLIARAALTYSLAPNQQLAAGYAQIATLAPGADTLIEHRGWQQYLLRHEVASLPVMHRFRLEQRYIEPSVGERFYSDRLRYMVRVTKPLAQESGSPFKQGWYVAAQNELFLNLSGQQKLNRKTFDQNRGFVGMGWRQSGQLEIEAGYLNQYVEGLNRDTQNHALSVVLFSKF